MNESKNLYQKPHQVGTCIFNSKFAKMASICYLNLIAIKLKIERATADKNGDHLMVIMKYVIVL